MNIHFKQPYWNGTIWKPCFMCQRGDLPEHWVFSWTDVPKHLHFFCGCFLHQKEFHSGWKIRFWRKRDPVNLPWKSAPAAENCDFLGELQELQLAANVGVQPCCRETCEPKTLWVLQIISYVVLMEVSVAWEQASRDPEGKVKLKLVLSSQLNFQQPVSQSNLISVTHPSLWGIYFFLVKSFNFSLDFTGV